MQRWAMAVGAAIALGSGAFVHASAQSTTEQSTTGKPAILTVTGCLRSGPDPDTYVLSNLKWKDAASPTGTSGTSGASTSGAGTGVPPAAASATSLRLVGSPAVRLGEHVGRMVEITGMLTDESTSEPALSEGATAAARARTGTGGDQTTREERAKTQARPEQSLSVRTVRTVGGSCTDGSTR